jgi:Leucine-rich repeat (LRR) protein
VALSDNLLGDQSSLERVSFANNQLQLVSSRLLPNRNNVELLDFTGNFVFDFPEELVSKCAALKKLHFRKV